MTDDYLIANPVQWKRDLDEYKALLLEFDQTVGALSEEGFIDLQNRLGEAEERVLCQPAPDADALIEKLTIIWDDEIWSEIDNGPGKRTVLGDLRRFQARCSIRK